MSLGDIFGDFFSPSQDTQTQTSNQQSSQFQNNGRTQNNMFDDPRFQGALSGYFGMSNPGAFNQYQTGAADRQHIATGMIAPGVQAASGIAMGGLNPNAINQYMSPYIQSVVNPTMQAFNLQNQQALSNIDGNLAAKGALGNSNNAATKAIYYQGVQPGQQQAIANLYNQGYNQATNTALQSQQQQLGATSALGSLLGQYTGANQAGFNMGQQLWQNPLQWSTQWAGAMSPFLGAAGMNTSNSGNSSGTSTGTSSSTTQYNPSMFQDIAGVAGLASSLMKMGGGGGGGGFGGLASLFARGGVIRGFADGGNVSGMMPFNPGADLTSKISHAFHAFKGMSNAYKNGGGVMKGYDGGGTVGPWGMTTSIADPMSAMGDDIVSQATSNQANMDKSKSDNAKSFEDQANKIANTDYSAQFGRAQQASADALARQQQGLTAFMQNSNKPPEMPTFSPRVPAFADGGDVDSNDPGTYDAPVEPYGMQRFEGDGGYADNINDPAVSPISRIQKYEPPAGDFGSKAGVPYSAPAMTPYLKDLQPEFASGFQSLYEAAKKDGIDLRPISGYRDEAAQRRAIDEAARRNDIPITPDLYTKGIPGVAAPVGKSLHQHGSAMDFDMNDQKTRDWLNANAPKYGFRFPYPETDRGHMELDRGNRVASAPASVNPRSGLPPYLAEPPKSGGESSWLSSIVDGFKNSPMVSGNWNTPQGNFSRALLAASGPHIGAPIAQVAKDIIGERLAQQNADRLHAQMMAQMTGQMPNGQLTLAGQKAPAELAHIRAQTKLAEIQSDKDYQLDVEKKKMEYAKDLEAVKSLQKAEDDINQAEITKFITPQQAETMRQQARRVYEQSRENYNKARTTPVKPAAVAPPGSTGTWSPENQTQYNQ